MKKIYAIGWFYPLDNVSCRGFEKFVEADNIKVAQDYCLKLLRKEPAYIKDKVDTNFHACTQLKVYARKLEIKKL